MKTIATTAANLNSLSDETLVQRILDGQEDACTVLVARHSRLVRFVLQRYLSDPQAIQEVLQDTFLRAFRALPGFRGESKFSTWLGRIAVTQAISRLRARRTPAWVSIEDTVHAWEQDLHDTERSLEKEEALHWLRQAVHRMNPHDATALELYYFHEQSIEEMSRITGWTPGNIKSRLSRARQRLHGALLKEKHFTDYFA